MNKGAGSEPSAGNAAASSVSGDGVVEERARSGGGESAAVLQREQREQSVRAEEGGTAAAAAAAAAAEAERKRTALPKPHLKAKGGANLSSGAAANPSWPRTYRQLARVREAQRATPRATPRVAARPSGAHSPPMPWGSSPLQNVIAGGGSSP